MENIWTATDANNRLLAQQAFHQEIPAHTQFDNEQVQKPFQSASNSISYTSSSQPWISFRVQPPESICGTGCACRCHGPRPRPDTSMALPGPLSSLFGHLLIGYSGSLTTRSRSSCHLETCRRGKFARLQLSYRFPAWFTYRAIRLLVEGTTSINLTMELTARRRVAVDLNSIHRAAQMDDIHRVQSWLKLDPSCVSDIDYSTGRSALHYIFLGRATPARRFEMLELLVRAGADLDYEDDSGNSARFLLTRESYEKYHAAQEALTPFTRAVLQVEFEVSHLQKIMLGIYDADLHDALFQGGSEIISRIDWLGDINRTPLELAVMRRDLRSVNLLLRAAEARQLPLDLEPAVRQAAKIEDADILKALLKAGFDVNHSRPSRGSILHSAAGRDSVVAIPILIAAGADINARSPGRWELPLHRAVKHDSVRAIPLLCQAGADINALSWYKRTPLMYAVIRNSHLSQEQLARVGADHTLRLTGEGEFVLWCAAFYGDADTLRFVASLDFSRVNPEVIQRELERMRLEFSQKRLVSQEEREAFRQLVVSLETQHQMYWKKYGDTKILAISAPYRKAN